MNRKTIINPQYQNLKEFVLRLPAIFDSEGVSIRKVRNEVKIFEVEGLRINVKRFCKPPYIFNRIIYKLLRGSKAERAYDYALRLLELGIDTPAPIAYIVESSPLLMGYSYFVSIQVAHPRDLAEMGSVEVPISDEMTTILYDLGRYTATLHKRGIYHKDYSDGNILFYMEGGHPQFCLVDINRMDFEPISTARGITNFNRLLGCDDLFEVVARGYAEELGLNPQETYFKILRSRATFKNRRSLKPKALLKRLCRR